MKKLLVLFFGFAFFALGISHVLAGNNLTVTCSESGGVGSCDVNPAGKPLFDEDDLKPGYNFYQDITVVNQSTTDPCHLYVSGEENQEEGASILNPVLVNTVSLGGSPVYQGTMADFFGSGSVFWGTVPAGQTRTFEWKLTMDQNAGNVYQKKSLSFDLGLAFTCREAEMTPTPTPLYTPTPTPTSSLRRVYLNEIMPNPASGDEWVELYNDNPSPATLTGWYIDDIPGASTPKIFTLTIGGFGYGTFDLSSNIFNNDGDTARLLDELQNEVEAVAYPSAEDQRGISYSKQPGGSWCFANPSKGVVNNTCLVVPAATVTPTSAPAVGGGTVGGATTGGGPSCSATAPGAPQNLTAVTGGFGEVILSWQPPATGTVTKYLVAYGTAPGVYLYGNPDIGNVLTYSVSQLSTGVRYYFGVRAINDCAPGPYANEATAVAGGAVGAYIAPGPAPGFAEGIMGEKTEEGELGGGISTEAGETAGAVTPPGNICFWWLVLSLLALIISYYYLGKKKKKELTERHLLLPLVLVVLAFLGDRFAHHWYTPSRFCPWMWLWSLLVFFLSWGLWYRRRQS